MFLIMGFTQGRKDFDINQLMSCTLCGAYGSFKVFMTYTVLSLFFIPTFKWGKKYYVETTCCHALYELDPEVGKRIANGENIEIRQEDLTKVMDGQSSVKVCQSCGYMTGEDFEYCPKCGSRF
ncbi:MAG: zinc ribbon domain-containing protein [Lachnospiraceae bacterium]|nr:zinc ribbon domain-containing protein [Lachnospiraceae bacterium]